LARLRAELDLLVERRKELRLVLEDERFGEDDDEAPPKATPRSQEDDAEELEKMGRCESIGRRPGVSAPATIDAERMRNWQKPHYDKPQEVRDKIKDIIGKNEKLQVLFGHLNESSVYDVIDAMKPVDVEVGTNLITQGEEGVFFYIVEEGTFDVFVAREDGPAGKVLEYNAGAMFGELALMYNAPRAATVTATSNAKVWALDRDSFQMMLATAENTKKSQYEEFLSTIELFRHMTKYEVCQLSDLLESELFDVDETLMQQGDEGTNFYILEDGEAKAYITGDDGEVEVMHYKTPGEYFGEVALIAREPRRATVRACGSGCTVLTVKKEDFDEVMGPIRHKLEKNIELYPSYADIVQKLRKS